MVEGESGLTSDWVRPIVLALVSVSVGSASCGRTEFVGDHTVEPPRGSAGAESGAGSSNGASPMPACAPGMVACAGVCVDSTANPRHCGSCGRVRATGESCVRGVCARIVEGACSCSPGFTRCGPACVDLGGDDEHCGSCTRRCGTAEACVLGSCTNTFRANWPTFGFDMQRTGVSTEGTGMPPLASAWTKVIAASPLNPVIVERGRVMVSANAPFLPGGSIREGIAYAVGAFGIRAYELASGTLIFVARADGVLSAYTLSEPP